MEVKLSKSEILEHLELAGMTYPINFDINNYAEKMSKNSTFIAEKIDNKIIGLCACYMNDIDSKIAFISHLAILPQQRGKGLSKKIMNETFEIAQRRGYKSVKLEVKKDNLIAINLYKKFNFKIIEDHNFKWLMEVIM